MRALIDTNVLLDLLLERPVFVAAADAIWQANIEGRFEGYISAVTPVNLFYIAHRLRDLTTAHYVVSEVLKVFSVCPLDGALLRLASSLFFKDYEDAVQCASAIGASLDCIVTRNVSDFVNASLPVLTPSEFLAQLESLPE
jgi:predicted nucleic acid-binding protein